MRRHDFIPPYLLRYDNEMEAWMQDQKRDWSDAHINAHFPEKEMESELEFTGEVKRLSAVYKKNSLERIVWAVLFFLGAGALYLAMCVEASR